MAVESRKAWFAVKKHGYGVGLPVAAEGWLVLIGYVIAMVLAGWLLPPLVFAAVAVLLTGVVLYISYVRSDDAWRWRNGE